VLGTVQLGMKYGIRGETQPDQTLATEIIDTAWKYGIREYDTAQGYGNSEKVLGKAFVELGISDQVNVISKFSPDLDLYDIKSLVTSLDDSCKLLGITRLHCMMLHREDQLDQWNLGIEECFLRLKAENKIQFTGISVYSPERAIEALQAKGIDIVQIPTNLLDQRFEKRGVFALARRLKKKLYLRSIFLQGLILMDEDEIEAKMSFTIPVVQKIEALCRKYSLKRPELALACIKFKYPDQKVIFGVDSVEQIKINVDIWNELIENKSLLSEIEASFNDIDMMVLDPSLWPK
jgi:aryl-alcohol dehydrogenase-like predicted oxidoreductase